MRGADRSHRQRFSARDIKFGLNPIKIGLNPIKIPSNSVSIPSNSVSLPLLLTHSVSVPAAVKISIPPPCPALHTRVIRLIHSGLSFSVADLAAKFKYPRRNLHSFVKISCDTMYASPIFPFFQSLLFSQHLLHFWTSFVVSIFLELAASVSFLAPFLWIRKRKSFFFGHFALS